MMILFDEISFSLRSCIYSPFISVPEPLEAKDQLTKNLYPWRSFSDR